jgi:hypothetical protein
LNAAGSLQVDQFSRGANMSDQFTTVTQTGYFSRIGNAIVGVLFGVLLFVAAIILLSWNEGHAVRTAKMLAEGAASVVSINADSIEPGNEGKLVHFEGNATGEKLTDPLFNASGDAIHLMRVVEMYQWKETEKVGTQTNNIGGGQTSRKTYTYDKVWSRGLIDSSNFNKKEYVNPQTMRVNGSTWTASQVKVGSIMLPGDLVSKIDNYNVLALSDGSLGALPADLKSDATISDGVCYVSGQTGKTIAPSDPTIGDLKISEKLAPPGPVSVIARQAGNSLDPYPARVGGKIALLYVGSHPAAEMFATEQIRNKHLTWGLRAAGFAAMWFGLMLILNPLVVLADVVGIIGRIVGSGVAIACFLMAITLSSITIAIAWIAYRPLIGGALLGLAVVGVILLVARSRRAVRAH